MQLDLNDIRTFVMVAQAGTFSAVAQELGLPTSTVSRSITRLERNVGILLCERSHKGLALTDPGREYLATCRRALRSLRGGQDMLDNTALSLAASFVSPVQLRWRGKYLRRC